MISQVIIAVSVLALIGTVTGKPKPDNNDPMLVSPELGPHIEGDMLPNPNGESLGKAGINNENARWPQSTLVYNIGSGFTDRERQLIAKAIEEIQDNTCIKFRPGAEGDYVQVIKGNSGCSSNVGRIGGRQELNLASGCFNVGHGTVMHEFIHALGFYHEQSRSDRDDFIRVNWERIIPFFYTNFLRQSNSVNFGVPYDYGSIMHYPRNAFAIFPFALFGLDTAIETRDRKAANTIGQRRQLSPLDIKKLNLMYPCKK